jgi:hypothetical protein
LNPTTIENLQYNVDFNFENDGGRVIARSINWDDEWTCPKEKLDYVIDYAMPKEEVLDEETE